MERKGMSSGFEIDFKCHLTPLAFWTGKLSISRERVERILFLAPASHGSDVAITEKTEKKGKAKLSSVAFNINRVLYMPSISVRHRRLDIDDWIKKGTDETTTCRLRTIITIYWFDLIQDHGREIIETKKRMKQMTCVRWRQRKTPLFGSFRIFFFFVFSTGCYHFNFFTTVGDVEFVSMPFTWGRETQDVSLSSSLVIETLSFVL